MPLTIRKRVAIYARSSTNVRTTETQLDTCRQVADELGFEVVHEFADENVSGTVPLSARAGGLELWSVRSGLDALIVYRVDRLSRTAPELLEIVRGFEHKGVEIWSVADLPFPARIATAHIEGIASFAELERRAILRRMQSGLRRAAEAGKWMGGPIPFGYDLDEHGLLTPSVRIVAGMTEADLARSVFMRLAEGSSTVKEARYLNELGVFPGRRYRNAVITMQRGTWLPSRVRAMVRNPLYKGLHTYALSTGPVVRGVAALVSPELWQSAQDRLQANRSLRSQRPKPAFLLTGLVFCNDCGLEFCGTWVSSVRNNWRGAYYRCTGQLGAIEPNPDFRCRAKSIPARSLEQLIWADCVQMTHSVSESVTFAGQREVVQSCVLRIGVRTDVGPPKVAFVRVHYRDGDRHEFRFARGDGVRL